MLTNRSTFLPQLAFAVRPRRIFTTLLASLAAAVAVAQAPATPVQLQENAPDRHVVVKGDTLWGISSKFLKSPWRWPEVWRFNKDQIKNPHLIYPGQTVYLDRNAVGGPRLSLTPPGGQSAERPTVVIGPQIRAEAREAQAIPSILPSDIEPFMVRNVVVGAETLDNAPQIVKSVGERVAFSTADSIYVVGVKPEMGKVFQLYRKGRELRDPSIPARPWYKWRHNEADPQVIGYEATYLGDAKLQREGEVARFEIVGAKQEVQVGDYLIPAPPSETVAYVPRAPSQQVEAVVMTLPSGISEAGKTNVVTLNRGKQHGLEVGHVLAAYKPTETFANPRYKDNPLNLVAGWPFTKSTEPKTLEIPEERVGLVFVFRVFDNISYGMVMNTGVENVRVGYALRNPQ
jgi:LysM domain